jgi:restriction system protein
MGRRSSVAEDLIMIVSRLPWWAGIGLAVVAYLVLRPVAGMTIESPSGVEAMGSMIGQQALKTFAMFGQYLLPVTFLIAAVISFLRRGVGEALHAKGAHSLVDGLSWQQFEALVGEAFRREGYTVRETGGGGADGGVDLVLTKGSERFLVQCKQWRALKVGVKPVRELYGVMAAKGAAGGMVVTSGAFTRDAQAFAEGRNIELIGGPKLQKMIRAARVQSGASFGEIAAHGLATPATEGPARTGEPACPLCAAPMLQRTAKRGAGAGQRFWGCSRYPACRGTLPLV